MIAPLFLLAMLAADPPGEPEPSRYEQSVVAISVTYQEWDEDRPWAKRRPGSRNASAVVVEGPFLLTTAQMVAQATLIRADKFGRRSRANPRVQFIDREANLALLAVDEDGFFDGLKPASLAKETPTEGTVRTIRWQEQQLEISASRVKRIEVEESWYGSLEHPFLSVQTDIESGGWAEPVFLEQRLVGLTSSQDEQRARVIPVEIIARFLERARVPGAYRGFPVFGFRWQSNTDPALSAWLGQEGEPSGILVRQIPWGSSGCGVLEPHDILLSLDGRPIDAEGYFTHPRMGQLAFPAIVVDRYTAGDEVPIQVLRKGKVLDLRMTLRDYPVQIDLVPLRRGDDPPPYVIAGGLVFRELDLNFLRTWGREWTSKAPLSLLAHYYLEQSGQRPGRRRIVVLAGVLPSEYTIGYQDLGHFPIESVNGRAIDGLDDIVEALRHPEGKYHVVRLEPNPTRHEIVLDAAGFDAATENILKQFGVPAAVRLPAAPPPALDGECPDDY